MKILLIGCGNLGGLVLSAWAKKPFVKKIVVVQPSLTQKKGHRKNTNVFFVRSVEDVPSTFVPDLTVLAVKPQHAKEGLSTWKKAIGDSQVISLMAGFSVQSIRKKLSSNVQVIRVIPNLAIKTFQSVTLLFAPPQTPLSFKKNTERLFLSLGKCYWLSREQWINDLTSITSSGPAYYYFLSQQLVAYTKTLGLNEVLARQLVQQTFLGSALLSEKSSDYEDWITAVSSKKGVTEAAFKVLRPQLPKTMKRALDRSIKRTRELSK